MTDPGTVRAAFDQQIAWCAVPSPFTAALLGILRDDLEAGGTMAALLAGWPGDPVADAVPLRAAAALHYLALSGTEPGLAALYPPAGDIGAAALGPAVLAAIARRRDTVRRFLQSPPQTNEVGRSAVLLGGFLTVASQTKLPLRLLEIGASAGLNSLWDRYGYEIAGRVWGNPRATVRLAPRWTGPPPPLDVTPVIAARVACDRAPVEVTRRDERLRLISYVWPDQADRLARVRAAVALCTRVGVAVERAEAAPWLEDRLRNPSPGAATVVFHSVMWQYMPAIEQARVRDLLEAAGARARPEAPLAWLRFEPAPGDDTLALSLSLWPGGGERRLAVAQAHGASVRWFGTGAG